MGENGGRRGETVCNGKTLIQKVGRKWMYEKREVRLHGQKWEH
jgi:hypothetical protein